MSRAQNAPPSNNAIPSETMSDLVTGEQSSERGTAERSDGFKTTAGELSSRPPRFDSLKDPIQESEPTQHSEQPQQLIVKDAEAEVGDVLSDEISTPFENLSVDTGGQNVLGENPPSPPVKDTTYLDPTPRTPRTSRPVSRQNSEFGEYNEKDPQYEMGASGTNPGVDELKPELVSEKDSQPEIQSIMEQFTGDEEPLAEERIMSPRMEIASPVLAAPSQFPPRRSSLEPLRPIPSIPLQDSPEKELPSPPVPPKPELMQAKSPPRPTNPASPQSLSQLPPPEPEPELSFDFHRFLEQLRHKSADPVAKFLRSFLTEFGKKQWMAHEQVKIIGDFLAFIANKMAQCDVWRGTTDTEFDNAKEGMEKLVMNRLYTQTFSPAVPPPQTPRNKGKNKEAEKLGGSGRRGQHQEDIERDDILAQKVRIYGWVTEEHLDIPSVGSSGEKFLKLAQQELLKIKGYRAPRDKVICVLNCCKVIFGLLKSSKAGDTSADSFVPLLIYVVLKANPDHLVSNIQYILRFRNQEKLGGEAGYYLSSLSGAIQFIESLDRTSLSVSDEEFEKNVEAAVSAIAERNREAEPRLSGNFVSEKSALSEPEVIARTSMDATRSSPSKGSHRSTLDGQEAGQEDHDAVAGLLRTIQRPLSTIGRIFSEDANAHAERKKSVSKPQPGSSPKLSPSLFQPPPSSEEPRRSEELAREKKAHPPDLRLDAQEAAARQASAEAAQARKIQRAEHRNVVETLYGMFPNLDRDVIDDVVRLKEGRVGQAVDACLALSGPS